MIQEYRRGYPKWITKCFIIIMIVGLLYIGAHLCIVYGVLKERENKDCISAGELSLLRDSLNNSNAICVDAQKRQLDEIKEIYENRVSTAEQEAERWKSYYLNQKKINEKAQEKNEEETTNRVEEDGE